MAHAADGKVIIDTQLNNAGFTRGVKGLRNQLGGLRSVVGRLGSIIASAFAVKAIVNFSKECIELGSNIQEVQNVVDTAFGDMTYKVEQFAETAIESFGMSRLAAKKTASTYMAMAKGMGLADEAASDMAIALAGLTGDVASFYNITQEAADTKLKSVFTGETESLKDLGVVMTQANLKAYALEKGIKKDLAAMTQAELVTLRYSYVMDALSLAQGDFAKTSDSWANQTRILSMQWQEFMSIVGSSLITVLTPAVKVLNEIVSAMINIASAINSVIQGIFGKQATQQANAAAVTNEIAAGVEQQEELTDATKETEKAQKGMLAGFDEITKISEEESASAAGGSGLSLDTAPIAGLAGTGEELDATGFTSFFDKIKNALEPFRSSFLQAVSDILAGVGRLKEVFSTIWSDLGTLVEPFKAWASGPLVDLINQFIVTFGSVFGGLLDSIGMVFGDIWSIVMYPTIQQWITDILPAMTEFATEFIKTFGVLFDEVKTIFDRIWEEAVAPALEVIQKIWSDAWDSVLAVWDKYGAPMFEKIREAIQNTSDFLQNVWEAIILPVWETFMSVVDELWTEHLKPLWDNFLDFVSMLADGALDIYNKFILPVANWFVDKFGRPISDTVSDMIEQIGDFFGAVVDAANYIIDALKGVVDFVVGVFTNDWKRAFSGVSSVFKGIINGMIVMAENFVNFFIRGINKIIGALNTISLDIPEGVPFIGGTKFGVNIQKASEIRLPRLATGAVVPPNREFLAVLGDNKHETEVVSPLSTMKQAMLEALRESGGGGGGTYTFVVNLDGKEVARNQIKHINNMTREAGKPVLLI